MKSLRLLLAFLCSLASSALARDVTFISTSDPHYREADHKRGNHNELNRASMLEMNRITEESWPEKAGGGKIAKPRGVLLLGDVIDDGDRVIAGRNVSAEQNKFFLADFGFDVCIGNIHFSGAGANGLDGFVKSFFEFLLFFGNAEFQETDKCQYVGKPRLWQGGNLSHDGLL